MAKKRKKGKRKNPGIPNKINKDYLDHLMSDFETSSYTFVEDFLSNNSHLQGHNLVEDALLNQHTNIVNQTRSILENTTNDSNIINKIMNDNKNKFKQELTAVKSASTGDINAFKNRYGGTDKVDKYIDILKGSMNSSDDVNLIKSYVNDDFSYFDQASNLIHQDSLENYHNFTTNINNTYNKLIDRQVTSLDDLSYDEFKNFYNKVDKTNQDLIGQYRKDLEFKELDIERDISKTYKDGYEIKHNKVDMAEDINLKVADENIRTTRSQIEHDMANPIGNNRVRTEHKKTHMNEYLDNNGEVLDYFLDDNINKNIDEINKFSNSDIDEHNIVQDIEQKFADVRNTFEANPHKLDIVKQGHKDASSLVTNLEKHSFGDNKLSDNEINNLVKKINSQDFSEKDLEKIVHEYSFNDIQTRKLMEEKELVDDIFSPNNRIPDGVKDEVVKSDIKAAQENINNIDKLLDPKNKLPEITNQKVLGALKDAQDQSIKFAEIMGRSKGYATSMMKYHNGDKNSLIYGLDETNKHYNTLTFEDKDDLIKQINQVDYSDINVKGSLTNEYLSTYSKDGVVYDINNGVSAEKIHMERYKKTDNILDELIHKQQVDLSNTEIDGLKQNKKSIETILNKEDLPVNVGTKENGEDIFKNYTKLENQDVLDALESANSGIDNMILNSERFSEIKGDFAKNLTTQHVDPVTKTTVDGINSKEVGKVYKRYMGSTSDTQNFIGELLAESGLDLDQINSGNIEDFVNASYRRTGFKTHKVATQEYMDSLKGFLGKDGDSRLIQTVEDLLTNNGKSISRYGKFDDFLSRAGSKAFFTKDGKGYKRKKQRAKKAKREQKAARKSANRNSAKAGLKDETFASVLKGRTGSGGARIGLFASGAFAVHDFFEHRENGGTVLGSLAHAAGGFIQGELLGMKGMLALGAFKGVTGLATSGTKFAINQSRSMNNMQKFTPFADTQFADTQQLATMRQSGMQLAQMSQYNLQQTLMGTEARHLHR